MKQADPFYRSKQWHGLRAKVKAKWKRQGRPCGYCGKPLDWNARPIVDHIQSRREAPQLALYEPNLQVVHHACNTRKAKYLENTDKPQIGADGYPV